MFDALAAPKWGGSPTLSAKPAFLPFAPQQLAAILGKNLAPPPLNPPSREGIYLHRNYLVMQSPLQFSAWHLEHSCIADTCKTKAASSIRRLPSWLAAVKNKFNKNTNALQNLFFAENAPIPTSPLANLRGGSGWGGGGWRGLTLP